VAAATNAARKRVRRAAPQSKIMMMTVYLSRGAWVAG
jgi:hypothetical protein